MTIIDAANAREAANVRRIQAAVGLVAAALGHACRRLALPVGATREWGWAVAIIKALNAPYWPVHKTAVGLVTAARERARAIRSHAFPAGVADAVRWAMVIV